MTAFNIFNPDLCDYFRMSDEAYHCTNVPGQTVPLGWMKSTIYMCMNINF